MSDYVLSCCSTVDLTPDLLASRNIPCVFFNYELDGEQCRDDFGKTNSPAELYAKMLAGAPARTSQVSVGEYEEHFKPILDEGHDILHVTLSSGISGSYQSALNAAADLKDQYPDRRIVVVDSLCASAGYGLFVDRLADKRDEGMGLDELAAWAEANRQRLQHWFFSTDLTFFVRGGRVSKAAGAVGGLLNICPLLTVTREGKLDTFEKIRTKKKAIKGALAKMHEYARDREGYDGKVFISNSECFDDARALADLIEADFAKVDGGVQIFDIGATIGCHTGPGTVALFFWGDERPM